MPEQEEKPVLYEQTPEIMRGKLPSFVSDFIINSERYISFGDTEEEDEPYPWHLVEKSCHLSKLDLWIASRDSGDPLFMLVTGSQAWVKADSHYLDIQPVTSYPDPEWNPEYNPATSPYLEVWTIDSEKGIVRITRYLVSIT